MVWMIVIVIASSLTCSVSGDTTTYHDAALESLAVESFENIARMPSHTVLMYFLEMDIKECSYECAKHLRCMTINYNFNQRICELVDSDFDKYEADYDVKDWINIGVPKINGNFSEWKVGSKCTVTCGNGTRRLVRKCDNPRPTLGGRDCEGETEKDEDCILKECPVDGNWNEWSEFFVMNDTCTGYIRSRNRTCGNPSPAFDGVRCLKFNGERDMLENESLFVKRECDYPGTYKMVSYGVYKNYAIGVRKDESEVYITRPSSWEFKIVPALNGVNGLYSFEPQFMSGYVLSVKDSRAIYSKKEELASKDGASFYIRKNKFFTDYIALEPYSMKNYFLRHENFKVRPQKSEENDRYKQDASFELIRSVINIALHKTASQSSTHRNYAANKAIDGKISTFSYTETEYNQWWSVDLNNIFQITYMVLNSFPHSILNRAVMVETRPKMDDAWLRCKKLGNIDTLTLKITCSEKTFARYVRIRSTERCSIRIDELEVYAPDDV